MLQDYFNTHPIRKLHLGCGNNLLPGWLNSDFFPSSEAVLPLDVTQAFPFADESFEYIFSEHLIEHIDYRQGQHMLRECCRILTKNGKIRISTPDLAFLIELYRPEKSALQLEYLKWATRAFADYAPRDYDTFVINNFVRAWGHQFIYDEKTLRLALEETGFSLISRWALNQSEYEAFRNLENTSRLPAGYLQLETFTLEAVKISA